MLTHLNCNRAQNVNMRIYTDFINVMLSTMVNPFISTNIILVRKK